MGTARKLQDSLSQVSGGPTKPAKSIVEQEKFQIDFDTCFMSISSLQVTFESMSEFE